MKTLTDIELNLAMCEWMGWQVHPENKWIVIPPNSPHSVQPRYTLPNYLSDDSPRRLLNEAEARLTSVLSLSEWGYRLRALLANGSPTFEVAGYELARANARQRVIAILQTVKPEIFQ